MGSMEEKQQQGDHTHIIWKLIRKNLKSKAK